MPERLHQPHQAVAVAGRAEEHRNDLVFVQNPCRDRIDRVARRLAVLDEFFQQPIVEFRKMLEKLRACLVFALERAFGDLEEGGRLSLAIAPGSLRNQIAAADDPVAVADGNLPQDERAAAEILQGGDDVPYAPSRLVHAVDEEDAGCAGRLDHAQVRGGENRLVNIGETQRTHASLASNACCACARASLLPGDVERAPGLAAEFEFGETQSIWRN